MLALGSCFAERIGHKLQRHFLDAVVNPEGTLYNPVSLARALDSVSREPQVFLHQGQWRSLDHHSQVGASRFEAARARLKEAQATRLSALAQAQCLLLTLGTARVFRLKSNARVVANCHRLPQSLFFNQLLSLEDVVSALQRPLRDWLDKGNERQVVLTVSPIRHLRPGLTENSLSKATLLLACNQLALGDSRIHYFPSYELMVDELRDYRYYDDKMVQPRQLAVDYIWKRFLDTFFTEKDRNTLRICQKLEQLTAHRQSSRTNKKSMAAKGLRWLDQLPAEMKTSRLEELGVLLRDWAS